MTLVSCDIGGTHARFCIATVGAGVEPRIGEPVTLRTGDYAGFAEALADFTRRSGLGEVADLAIAFAGPVSGPTLKLTNSAWLLDSVELAATFERLTIVNDFGAVAHAVAVLQPSDFALVCGPEAPLPAEGVISIVGPGTGLGVAMLLRDGDRYRVVETEGGHMGFAPADAAEDAIAATLRERFGRVSIERLASGSGLAAIYAALSGREAADHHQLWREALDGSDSLALEALDRFCRILGAAAGDVALAQGAKAVVIAGGLGRRLINHLPGSSFAEGFTAKGRFRAYMEAIPVKLVTHPEPGLLGAAAAFAQEHC